MKTVSDYFGVNVFDDRVMKATLSAEVYNSLKQTIDEGKALDVSVANAVASAMKDWAISNSRWETRKERANNTRKLLRSVRSRWHRQKQWMMLCAFRLLSFSNTTVL